MTKISIHQTQGQEMLDVLYSLNQYSLHPSPPYENREEWNAIASCRKGVTCFTAYKNEKPVSVAVSTAMTQNIRGKLYPASGVWGVSTDPAVRREGYCRQTIAALLHAEIESGKVFSNLYPFRESFYERMGYIAFPLEKVARFTTSSLSPLLKLKLDGEIELKLIGDVFDIYRDYLKKMREHQHGMGVFDEGDHTAAKRNRFWVAIARINGKVEGLMIYRITGEEVTKYNFVAIRFYYQSSQARYLMLNWIARHIDQSNRAEIWLPAFENPELWYADLEVKVETAIRPSMTRILDVKKIGGMTVGKGNFSAKIIDPLCTWNEGFWKFESIQGSLQVSKTTKADFDLKIQGLSALIAGTRDPQDFQIVGWGNPNPNLQAVMQEMFPPAIPYLHENF
ncbi:MAG: GNAT family N-acetyltransferase [Anaerolineaceae bacterium]|nr:GNAT family N-acetyltransferase [Anaerolineaceae bacterium]